MTFQEVLLRRGIRFRTSSGDSSKVHVCCPFCIENGKSADVQFHLCVHAREGWGRCMYCGWRHRYAVVPVLKQLGIMETVTGFEKAPDNGPQVPVEFPKDFQVLTHVYDDLDRQAKKYIRDRGVTEEQIRSCRIGVSYAGRYAYRILFPVFVGKVLKGINARDFTGIGKPKYLNSQGDKYLFRFDPKQSTTILSEGVIKALRIAQVTEFGSAALLGHDLTEQQLAQILESRCQHVILYPDTDSVGVKGAVSIADKLCECWKGKVSIVEKVVLPADEVPLAELKQLLVNNVVPYSERTRQRMRLRPA